jgi:hypothetical protein
MEKKVTRHVTFSSDEKVPHGGADSAPPKGKGKSRDKVAKP